MQIVFIEYSLHEMSNPVLKTKHTEALFRISIGDNFVICFLFLHKSICCGYSLEEPRQGASNEYSQHMFLLHRGASNEYLHHMF